MVHHSNQLVMLGLDPGIRAPATAVGRRTKTQMAGTSPAMTIIVTVR
jgi:hypothetical protein